MDDKTAEEMVRQVVQEAGADGPLGNRAQVRWIRMLATALLWWMRRTRPVVNAVSRDDWRSK